MGGALDFLYVPQAAGSSRNAGHAFLNFRSLHHLNQFNTLAYYEGLGTLVNADVPQLEQHLQEFRESINAGINNTDQAWHPMLIDTQGNPRSIPDGKELNADAPPFVSVT